MSDSTQENISLRGYLADSWYRKTDQELQSLKARMNTQEQFTNLLLNEIERLKKVKEQNQ